ncbi:hypothetical protein [Cellulomonas denverensis]|uniref:Type II secretion system protein GspF domain-containing protein n=1 Tax=Cellulomonas denverensis TaxID=264297 RepID=A0A7X6KTF8_9CELL|nr:hypothetical protein [Cellulomonas denverensis]NKY21688.1 hypothetical protein [Cellulomonas denverensis]
MSPTAELIRLLGAVAAGLRAGGSPAVVWEAHLGVGVGPDGVPELDVLLRAVGIARGAASAVGTRAAASARAASPAGPVAAVSATPTTSAVRVAAAPAAPAIVAARHAGSVLAACRVAAELGAPLAPVLERAIRTVEAEHEAEAETAAALAAPRQTVRLLSWLPLWGVLLGVVVGAAPLAVLLDGGVGSLCLLLGGTCALLGRWWIGRLVARARAAGSVDAGRR